MRVGNDVVDLRAAENQPAAIHPRFDERVFSPSERTMLERCPDAEARHALRWTLWAARESSLKLFLKADPRLPFHPAEFTVSLTEDQRTATVAYRGRSAHVGFDQDYERVHAVACDGPPGRAVVAAETHRVDPSAPPEAASARVRLLAARTVARVVGWSTADAEIAAPIEITALGDRVPRARHEGSELPVDVSLSHDGAWVAHAVARAAGPPGRLRGYPEVRELSAE